MVTRFAPLICLSLLFLLLIPIAAQDAEPLPLGLPPGVRSPDSIASESNIFVHLSAQGSATNIYGNRTRLVSEWPFATTSPLTDTNPTAAVFVTPNTNVSATANTSPIAVEYMANGWHITNLNGTVFPNTTAYNVSVHGYGPNVLRHVVTAESILPTLTHVSLIDHPLLNGNTDAVIIATQVTGGGLPLNNNNIGVYFDGTVQKWSVFNQNFAAMPVGAVFNLYISPQASELAFTHTATGTNSTTLRTTLNNPNLNGNVSATFHVTPNWRGEYFNQSYSVDYDSGVWEIVATSGSQIPLGVSFNVYIVGETAQDDGILINGGFEVDSPSGRDFPLGWNTANAGINSKRICNRYAPARPVDKIRSHSGNCAYVLRGNPAGVVSISQNIPLVRPSPNNSISLRAYVRGVTVSSASIQAKGFLTDGTVARATITDLAGSYDYRLVQETVMLPSIGVDVMRLKVNVSLRNTSGALFIDSMWVYIID